MFVHLVYFIFNNQRIKKPTLSNLLTGWQSAPCVLWGSSSTRCLTQQFKKAAGKVKLSWYILSKSQICAHTYHIRTSHMSLPNRPKSTQINVQAVKWVHRGVSTPVDLHPAAFAFCSVFSMQLWALCILALQERGCHTGCVPRSRSGKATSNHLELMLIF